ncbi:hypothetical protein GF354_05640, partial [Candidatus Peregrinibacteria bacterium]|nr:hypothetical protein [Candidatus Peregrinibacteria bacterium]
ISNGNTVVTDNDTTNELQSLQLAQDTLLSLTGKPGTVNLGHLLDNTDKQEISFNSNDTTLSISNGNTVFVKSLMDNTDNQTISFENGQLGISNGNTVDISSKKIAFRASKKAGSTPIFVDDSTTLIFNNERLDFSSNYNHETGIFTVPEDGSGIYYFQITYNFVSDIRLRIIKNGSILENILFNKSHTGMLSYPFVLELQENDTIQIRFVVVSGSFASTGEGYFTGHKLF